jgi:hypothetical protein
LKPINTRPFRDSRQTQFQNSVGITRQGKLAVEIDTLLANISCSFADAQSNPPDL